MADYYAILGVERSASAEDIKRAYRKLARDSHPDHNPDDAHAEDRFKQLSEAYAVLSDPQKRQRYDTYGDAGLGGQPLGGFGDIGDIMEAFFGGSPFGRQRTRTRSSSVPGQDVGVGVSLTLEQAVFGAQTPVELVAAARCETCLGDGCAPGTYRSRCGTCGGQGEVRATRQTILGTVVTSRPCHVCAGAGEAPTVPCTSCGGEGRVRASRTVTVEIPPGVDDGTTLRLRGQGEAGVRGGPDGDLFVQVHVSRHEIFERDGHNLVCDLAVPLTQAVLGADIPVHTLDGEETIQIAPGTQHGSVMRLRGLGAHRLDGRGRGDLLVHISVEIPRKLGVEERSLFEKLAEVRGEPVGGGERGIFGRLRDTLRGQ